MRTRLHASSVTLLTTLTLLSSHALAQGNAPTAPTGPLPAGTTFVTQVEGISEYRLENGLKVLLFPDDSKPTMTVNVTYLVGSRHENYGETGMAHLLEHLVFKGTPTHPNIPAESKERGVNFNGSTGDERTNYYMTMPASEANLKWALDLESDRMINSFIAKKDLDSEMTVVRNEFERGENDPLRVLWKQLRSVMFDWHNLGNTTIGNRSDIENVPIERLQTFYKKYYQPDNAVLMVTGKFTPTQALTLITQSFNGVPKPSRTLEANYTVEPTQEGERNVVVERAGDERLVLAGYHIPSALHPDWPAISVMTSVLIDDPAGRLYKALVEPKKAVEVAAYVGMHSTPSYLFYYTAFGKDDNLETGKTTLVQTLENFGVNPPTAAEVDRIKAQEATGFEGIIAKPETLGVTLSEYMALGDWRMFFYLRDAIQKVTPADVQRVARAYLKSTNRTLATFTPNQNADRAVIPAAPSVSDVLKGYQGRTAIAAGEALDPAALKLEARITRDVPATGLRIATLPKKTRGEKIELTLVLEFGSAESLRNRTMPAGFVGSMLSRGSEGLTRQELADTLARLKTTLSVSSNATSATIRLSTDRTNLNEAMKLLSTVLRHPSWPANEFEQLKRETLTALEAARNEPDAAASRAWNRHLMPPTALRGDVKYAPTIEEELEDLGKVTLEDVKNFYRDFWGADSSFLGAVGDFDAKTLSDMARSMLNDWHNATPYVRIPNVATLPAAVNTTIQVPEKANAYFYAVVELQIKDTAPDWAALLVANNIFGGGSLSSRIANRLRQQDGLSYSVGSGFSIIGNLDERSIWLTFAIYAPQNLARLEQAFREEIERVLKDGFTAQELEAAKQGILQSRLLSRTNEASLATTLTNQLRLGRTFAPTDALDQQIAALTLEEVNAAWRKYIDPARISIFKAGTFK